MKLYTLRLSYRFLAIFLTALFLLVSSLLLSIRPVAAQTITELAGGGTQHSLGLASDGTVFAWGSDGFGQLGTGSSSTTPVQVPSLSGVTAVSAGSLHSVALKSDGTVFAWGRNASGQLGDGTTTDSSTPTQVLKTDNTALTNIVAIAAGNQFTLALDSSGNVWAFGRNQFFQLGATTSETCDVACSTKAVKVEDSTDLSGFLSGAVAISAGGDHALALMSNGTIRAWGFNARGQTGTVGASQLCATFFSCVKNPSQVQTLTNVLSIAAGGNHSVAITPDNTVWTWGLNTLGQLGDGTAFSKSFPVQVKKSDASTLSGITAVAAGAGHTLVLDSSGNVWAWGTDRFGTLGATTTEKCIAGLFDCSTTAIQVEYPTDSSGFLTGIAIIAAGTHHSLAGNTVFAWGQNISGTLGDGTTTQRDNPVQISFVASAREYTNSSLTETLFLEDAGTGNVVALSPGASVTAVSGSGEQYTVANAPASITTFATVSSGAPVLTDDSVTTIFSAGGEGIISIDDFLKATTIENLDFASTLTTFTHLQVLVESGVAKLTQADTTTATTLDLLTSSSKVRIVPGKIVDGGANANIENLGTNVLKVVSYPTYDSALNQYTSTDESVAIAIPKFQTIDIQVHSVSRETKVTSVNGMVGEYSLPAFQDLTDPSKLVPSSESIGVNICEGCTSSLRINTNITTGVKTAILENVSSGVSSYLTTLSKFDLLSDGRLAGRNETIYSAVGQGVEVKVSTSSPTTIENLSAVGKPAILAGARLILDPDGSLSTTSATRAAVMRPGAKASFEQTNPMVININFPLDTTVRPYITMLSKFDLDAAGKPITRQETIFVVLRKNASASIAASSPTTIEHLGPTGAPKVTALFRSSLDSADKVVIGTDTLAVVMDPDTKVVMEQSTDLTQPPTVTNESTSQSVDLFLEGEFSLDDDGNFTALASAIVLEPGQTVTVVDSDGDGLLDDIDHCPAVFGTTEFNGCPSAIDVQYDRHTVQTGTQPSSTKAGVSAATVNAYDKSAGSCAAVIGISPKNYETILTGNPLNGSDDLDGPCTPVNSQETDATGAVRLGLTAGDYLLVSQDPQTSAVAGVASDLLATELKKKRLQVIVRADGSTVPAKTTKRTGSELLIIEPEYIEWSTTEELYPYLFESIGDWGIAVTIVPPEGFTADTTSLSTDVNTELKALQFTLTDVGTCWECETEATFTLTHKGQSEKIRSHTRSALTEDYAKKKGLDPEKLAKKGVKITKKSKKPKRTTSASTATLAKGDTIWSLVKRTLGDGFTNSVVMRFAKSVAQRNDISVPEWGLPSGTRLARALRIGTLLDLKPLYDYMVQLLL